ncbi:class IV adenylate cyclase [Zhihengliuella halotolerans]|uniref:Adenylate cyclase n=1 Tax=Zhihengliuella halotolerans TaxID=370736 RepID=A0A4Q8AFV2_9MICC|nr:class IV adenylate cyclase [Zhihengliuella halotolerans]RZU63212.1 adenylate cyclase [Zhihengliuella halotolerans]
MPTNIEIKARAADPEGLQAAVVAMADAGPDVVEQDDTFFACPNGRLKLRVLGSARGVLIFYRRADDPGPASSYYVCSETSDPDGLRAVLAAANDETGRVRKRRTVYRIGRTRVHLDAVEGLGDFVELEVPVDHTATHEAAVAEAHRLLGVLGIDAGSLVEGAYVDLRAGD